MVNLSHLLVENMCKTPCISQRNSCVNFRANLHPLTTTCANQHFPTNFSQLSHLLSHHPPTSIFQLFFPLFHRPYYYHYNINILERN